MTPCLVRVLDRITDPDQQLQPLGGVELRPAGVLGQRRSLDVLHRDIRKTAGRILVNTRLVNLGDPRVPETAEHLGFVLEAAKK